MIDIIQYVSDVLVSTNEAWALPLCASVMSEAIQTFARIKSVNDTRFDQDNSSILINSSIKFLQVMMTTMKDKSEMLQKRLEKLEVIRKLYDVIIYAIQEHPENLTALFSDERFFDVLRFYLLNSEYEYEQRQTYFSIIDLCERCDRLEGAQQISPT